MCEKLSWLVWMFCGCEGWATGVGMVWMATRWSSCPKSERGFSVYKLDGKGHPGGSVPFFRPSPPRRLHSSKLSNLPLPKVRPLCRSCSSRPRICTCHRCSHLQARPPWSGSRRPFQLPQYGLEALCCSSPAACPGSIYEACGLLSPWRSSILLDSMRSSGS